MIENLTCRPLYNVPISIQVDGGAIINEIIPGPIPRFGNFTYTFTATFDMSAVGNHIISVTTNLATDATPANDNLVENRISGAPIVAFPYTEDFNASNGGWVSRTTDDTRLFVWDTIPYLNGQQGQGNSWSTKVTGNNGAYIWVESPIFDFSALSNPQLFVDIKHSLHSSDFFHVEYSLNGGSTWTQLGTGAEPNWYNGTNWWRNSFANPVDQWTTFQHGLCNLAGQPCVKLRFYGRPYYGPPSYPEYYKFAFDNIRIREGGDVGVIAHIDPNDQGCLFTTTQSVTVQVFNFSCQPVSNIPVTSDITGVLNTTLTGTVPGPIPAGGFVNYTFTTTIDMTPNGTYNFNSYTSLVTDIANSNDTSFLSIIVDQITINTFPYFEDFNAGPAYWIASGNAPPLNNGRNFNLGPLPYLNGPEGYGDSWYVDATGNNGTYIWVESPVFDFTSITNPKMLFDIKHSLHSSDFFHVEYTINGGTTWIQLGSSADPYWYNSTNWWRNSFASPVDSWTTVEIPLCNLIGEGCVKFRIYGRPYYGNPSYPEYYKFAFDNFHLTDTPIDAEVLYSLSCFGSQYQMDVTIFNNDRLCLVSPNINSIDVSYSIDGGATVTQNFTGLNIPSGQSATVTIPNITIPASNSTVVVSSSSPNGLVDQIWENDTLLANALNWPNCNDHCSNAIGVGIGSTTISQTSNATVNPGVDPLFPCGSPTLENTVWYYFTTDSIGGNVTVSFLNTVCTPSSNGIQVSINEITGSPCDSANYTNVFCANNGNINDIIWGPQLLPPNTQYYITIDGYAGNDCVFDLDIQGAIVPLPIELQEFKGACFEDNVTLNWSTASENNNDYFEIYRSTENLQFESIATINGAGNSIQTLNYIFRDEQAINGVGYYKLKQVDFDGDYTFSDIISVDCRNNTESVVLYPNPTERFSFLTINSPISTSASIKVYENGRLISTDEIELDTINTSYKLDAESLSPGVYTIIVELNEKKVVKKWVVSK